ncbi:MAG: energy transducer TonB [Mucilaginibacter sp.]
MKRLIVSFLFVVWTIGLFAQQKGGVVITRDTINLSGYVYNYDGTPCFHAFVESKQKDTIYNAEAIRTYTDENGYFKLNGAKFQDTILVYNVYNHVSIFNKGSRVLAIYLPFNIKNLTAVALEVKALRKKAKPAIKFTTKKVEPVVGFWENEFEPEFVHGVQYFKQNIQQKLKYPEQAVENNIEGIVEIEFAILQSGKLGKFKVLKGLGYGCEDQIIQILKNGPQARPGLISGRKMEVHFIIDIEFKLTDN